MKKVLITGCLGHIGSYVVNELSGYDLCGIDDFSTQRYSSLFHNEQRWNFREKDFTTLTSEELESYDIILHLASITDAASSFNKLQEIERTNLVGTMRLVDLLNQCKSEKLFIFPSTTSVYGIGSSGKYLTEDDDSYINPQSPYAESKYKCEEYIRENCKKDYLIYRLGTIFGISKGMRFHTSINKLSMQAALGLPLTIWKQNYKHYRPYLGLGDCVQAIKLGINKQLKCNETYNVLTDNYKLCDIVEIMEKKRKVELNFIDTPLLNQHSYLISKKKMGSKFVPKSNLEVSIDETINLFRGLNE